MLNQVKNFFIQIKDHAGDPFGDKVVAQSEQNGRFSLNLGQKILSVAIAVTAAAAVAFGILAVAGTAAATSAGLAGGVVGFGAFLLTTALLKKINHVTKENELSNESQTVLGDHIEETFVAEAEKNQALRELNNPESEANQRIADMERRLEERFATLEQDAV